MSVTLDDVKLARKRAYDRVDYWLQKYRGMTIHEAGISIPRIPKDLHPSEYGEWFDYFESFTGAQEEGGTEDYLEGENEPPELNPEYHNEPEPIEPDLPEEPEPPEPAEDEWEDDDWWYGIDVPDDDTAPDTVDLEEQIKDWAYGISDDTGEAISEALDILKEQFENVGDLEGYQAALEDVSNDTWLWDSLQRANRYRKYEGKVESEGGYNWKDPLLEFHHAMSKLFRHFGLKYYMEI